MAINNIHVDETDIKSLAPHIPTFNQDDQPLSLEAWQRHFRNQIEHARCAILTDTDREELVKFIREHVGLIFYSPHDYPGVFDGGANKQDVMDARDADDDRW